MNLRVDLNTLSRPARAFLRAVADYSACHTRMDHAARAIARRYVGLREKLSARAEADVRRKLRERRLVVQGIDEAAALQGFLDIAVNRLSDYGRPGRTLPAERELHRFARSLHLANILEMRRGEVA